MISRVVLAKLSPTMEEGTIVKWSKKEGDAVKVGDVLAEIETDKANMEMEALAPGVLRKIRVTAGGKAPVGALIGVVADPKEDISAVLAQAPAVGAPVVAPVPSPAPSRGPAPARPPLRSRPAPPRRRLPWPSLRGTAVSRRARSPAPWPSARTSRSRRCRG